jgi:hypothetical protein
MSDHSNESVPFVKSANKTKPFKKFNSMWLKDPLFKNWLTSDKNNIHLCKCIACNKAGKIDPLKNIKCHKHSISVKNLHPKQKKVNELLQIEASEHKKKQDHVRKVKNFELMLSTFFAFFIVDHLTEILKSGVPDSQIIADMQLKRTKSTKY